MKTPLDVMQRQVEHPVSAFMSHAERQTERDDIYSLVLTPEIIIDANLGFELVEVPGSIAIRGGAARQVLEAAVHKARVTKPPRDVDILLDKHNIDEVDEYGREKALADYYRLKHKLAPRDAEYDRDGAEELDRIEEYMRRQDFTINQVLLLSRGGTWCLFATTQAIIDMAQSVIRPTLYEHNDERGYYLGNKLALKAVRLLSEMQQQGRKAAIRGVDLERDTYGDPRQDDFMQLLHLDKALGSGHALACCYVNNLRRLGIMPDGTEECEDPVEVYRELRRRGIDFVPSREALVVVGEREAELACRNNLATCAIDGHDEVFGVPYSTILQAPRKYTKDYF